MRRPLSVAALAAAAVLALQGCGGSVAVRSNFAHHAPPPSAGKAPPGLHAKGGTAFAAALVLGLIVVDAVNWAAHRLSGSDDPQPSEPPRPLFQRIDRGWVDRGP